MHEKILPSRSLDLLKRLGEDTPPQWRGWTLAGGTGLALQLGHRLSEDFVFFRTDDVDVRALHGVLAAQGRYETLQESEHTLTVLIRRTKLSFFRVRDPFLYDRTPHRFFDVAHVRDIALMKLAAISGRGSRRDFVDLFAILRDKPTLREYFRELPRKYGSDRVNVYHILKSLTWFEDAELEPMPRMLEPFNWDECKSFFIREARSIVLG